VKIRPKKDCYTYRDKCQILNSVQIKFYATQCGITPPERYVFNSTRTVPPEVKIGPLTKGIVAAARLRFSTADALFSVVAQSALTTAQRSTDLALRYRNWTNFHLPRMVRTGGSSVYETYKLRSDGKLLQFRFLRT
jgi:predicted DNA-binding transcriptional regulator AlpA